MQTFKIPKHPLTFYVDWIILDGGLYVIQERKDGRKNPHKITNTDKTTIVELTETEDSITIFL